jgi:hypothetical protein
MTITQRSQLAFSFSGAYTGAVFGDAFPHFAKTRSFSAFYELREIERRQDPKIVSVKK